MNTKQNVSTDFDKFENFARKIVQVPKAEADAEERKYQKKRKRLKKKTARRK